ncbi:putative vacuolar segregation protein (Pep7) [Aspergillus clavatus NRRL 1]|uniref:Vacuolar segregation protein (Pep7), putative n=1 Tax=Aspergillus clavatus (strain ATCC 1007 / CBS 513.65 / DSM 816 / NCTC 3887 / NRRL 1 / QM 1276 / 107) TaxID=344612 RepID=A1CLB8_ASPCL|nr:vacuolar segregation protein (Pep7), putative [Aspergillus clavatus NRRL 1]EAW09942.1 vacuolar segregation protein (Pep7), putative [Aspergillus clavatus NRRL 1]
MSRRTLGGGRVLGTPNALAVQASTPSPRQKPSILSPSASSLSLSSQASASQFSSETQDLTSRISLDNGATSISAAPAATGAQLACPICSEEMVTLLQLNRHLDDVHQNLEDDRQDEVKDWFKLQMEKAKRFQPLAVLNQKLKGLDVFESNENQQPSIGTSRSIAPQPGHSEPPRIIDPEDIIIKDHWQGRGLYDTCLEPSCGKRLNATNGCVNCRKCGKLFCEEHTMYQMRLSRSAQHEPVRGLWYRVCETCYKSREGYNDHNGVVRDRMAEFKAVRKQTVDKATLEVSRLEKRLTRLTQGLAALPPDQIQSSAGKRWPISWQNDQRKALEQTIVSWQEDSSVPRCPFCQQDFSSYTFRRHHCRTCGRVVCGDPATGCSNEVPLSITSRMLPCYYTSVFTPNPSPVSRAIGEKSLNAGVINIDIRLCKDCKATLFDRRDFQADVTRKPPDVRAYENLVQFERGIRLLLPKFQRLLTTLQDPRRPPTATQLAEASKVRKRLTDSFAQYDVAARRVRDMPTDSPTQKRLQKAVYQQASNFLHLHMLPLKALPKILKHASSNGRPASPASSVATLSGNNAASGHQRRESALASIKYGNIATSGSNSSLASDTSSAVSALEAEEKSLRERLIVLEEQKFFVSEMIADANRRRKFDEVSSLAMNIEDLSREIDRINGILDGLDFESVYTANQPHP